MNILKKLIDPFRYVAGLKALAWGAGFICAAIGWLGYAGCYQNAYLHFGPVAGGLPLLRTAVMQLAMWFVPALLLWGCGALLSRSRIRAVDVFGTTALAQAPLLLLVLPLGCEAVTGRLDELAANAAAGVLPSASQMVFPLVFAFGSLAVLAWFFLWNYRAYATSCNLGGWRAGLSYAAVVVAVTVLSQFAAW